MSENYQFFVESDFVNDDTPAWKMLENVVRQWVVMRKHEEHNDELFGQHF